MDQRVRDYLVRAHSKVIGHYHKVLQSSSLSQPERERIQQRLASIEAELEAVRGSASNLDVAHAADRPDQLRQRYRPDN